MKMTWARRFCRRLGLGGRGTAAVEFAMVAPVLVLLFIGTSEILTLYRTEAKLNAVAGDVAALIALQNSPEPMGGGTTNQLSDVCTGAGYGLAPFGAGGLTLAIASVTNQSTTTNGVTTPAYDIWEVDKACPTTASPIGDSTAQTLATGSGTAVTNMLPNVGDNIIIVRATLRYPGLTGLILSKAITLTQTAYARWRYASFDAELYCTSTTICINCAGNACTPPSS